jgi:outer membrane lipoprotein LolB
MRRSAARDVAARRACVVASLGIVAACAAPMRAVAPELPSPLADAAFDVSGRLSARRGSEAAAANFRWSHAPGRDELVLASPLGQTLARLEGDASRVRLELPDGRAHEAGDWEALTSRVLGAPVPVRGLAWWIRGGAHPSSGFTVERDAAARVSVLRQDGWEIVYDFVDGRSAPSRLRMSYPETEIRLVVDDWSTPPH